MKPGADASGAPGGAEAGGLSWAPAAEPASMVKRRRQTDSLERGWVFMEASSRPPRSELRAVQGRASAPPPQSPLLHFACRGPWQASCKFGEQTTKRSLYRKEIIL